MRKMEKKDDGFHIEEETRAEKGGSNKIWKSYLHAVLSLLRLQTPQRNQGCKSALPSGQRPCHTAPARNKKRYVRKHLYF